MAVSDQRYELDNYINHITKEEQLKKIFYSDHYYNYERDQRIMQNLPEPKPEKLLDFAQAPIRLKGAGRPTKKERRQLDSFSD